MDRQRTPPAAGGGRSDNVLGADHLSKASALRNASTLFVLRRLLDGIEKRRRKQLPPDQLVTWIAGVLRKEIAAARRREGGR